LGRSRLPKNWNFFFKEFTKTFSVGNQYLYMRMRDTSIAVNTDYMMIMYNPVLEEYEYMLYHVLDISTLNGQDMVSIQYTDTRGNVNRKTLSHSKFAHLVLTQTLIALL